jgi:hypothetical protein
MRLRNRRKSTVPSEPAEPTAVGGSDIDVTATAPWSVEQLNALGPVTGPSHRTFVPIVRSTLGDNPL